MGLINEFRTLLLQTGQGECLAAVRLLLGTKQRCRYLQLICIGFLDAKVWGLGLGV